MGQQETRVPVTREDYIDALRDVAYMAEQVVFDDDAGKNPEGTISLLRQKVTAWRSARDAYHGVDLGSRFVFRSPDAHPTHEDLEPVAAVPGE